jgi:hypothetical protein
MEVEEAAIYSVGEDLLPSTRERLMMRRRRRLRRLRRGERGGGAGVCLSGVWRLKKKLSLRHIFFYSH